MKFDLRGDAANENVVCAPAHGGTDGRVLRTKNRRTSGVRCKLIDGTHVILDATTHRRFQAIGCIVSSVQDDKGEESIEFWDPRHGCTLGVADYILGLRIRCDLFADFPGVRPLEIKHINGNRRDFRRRNLRLQEKNHDPQKAEHEFLERAEQQLLMAKGLPSNAAVREEQGW